MKNDLKWRLTAGLLVLLLAALAGIWLITSRRIRTAGKAQTAAPLASAESAEGLPAKEPHGTELHPTVDERFVGSHICARCHLDVWEAYQRHPMAHSTSLAMEAALIEDYAVHNSFTKPASRRYTAERTPVAVHHHEIFLDANRESIVDYDVEVEYAVGSGRRGRSYLVDHGGMLYVSPISWYAKAGEWDLSPNYPPGAHPRFDRRANDGCLNCHAGRLQYERGVPDRYGDPPFLELGISCERCHGPGREHVQFHEAPGPAVRFDPIVNPAALRSGARDDVCNQCHLQGQKRILRYGRTFHDFVPGMRLEDVWTVFVAGLRNERDKTTKAVSQVEQMHSSTCFRQSRGKMGCTSCHDPHSPPVATERDDFFNRRCQACHQPRDCTAPPAERRTTAVNDSCIHCHMPRLDTNDVPHTAQTDHRVLRRPPAAADGGHSTGDHATSPQMFDGAETRLPELDLERALALMTFSVLETTRDMALAAALETRLLALAQARPDDVAVLRVLGKVYMYQQRPSQAEQVWNRLLRIEPDDEQVLQDMATLMEELGDFQRALEYTERYGRIERWEGNYYAQLTILLARTGNWQRALDAAEKGLRRNPGLSQLREWLAASYQRAGQPDKALEHQRILQRMNASGPR